MAPLAKILVVSVSGAIAQFRQHRYGNANCSGDPTQTNTITTAQTLEMVTALTITAAQTRGLSWTDATTIANGNCHTVRYTSENLGGAAETSVEIDYRACTMSFFGPNDTNCSGTTPLDASPPNECDEEEDGTSTYTDCLGGDVDGAMSAVLPSPFIGLLTILGIGFVA